MSSVQSLWQEVLFLAIGDALEGVSGLGRKKSKAKAQAVSEARNYITIQNKGFDDVCILAGFDPEIIRAALIKRIAEAPAAFDLAATRKRKTRNRATNERRGRDTTADQNNGRSIPRGVVSNFGASLGTGVGSNAQETPKITFQDQTI